MKKVFISGGSGFIGTNLASHLLDAGYDVFNYDIAEPLVDEQRKAWTRGDIMDREALCRAMRDYSPDWAIHMAARTDTLENTTVEKDYRANTEGTRNFLDALVGCPDLERTIITSSQFVCGPGKLPESDTDYFPHTVYGRSKAIAEEMTRTADPSGTWTIIRPVNIWGPHHARYAREFWKIASMGLYIHPDIPAPTRTYGYVRNVVHQIMGLLQADSEQVHRKVFYVGDPPVEIDRWSLGFYRAFRGKDPLRVPYRLIRAIAMAGDLVSRITGKPFYITSSRLQSMSMDYPAPMQPTFDLLGPPPYSLEEGIRETAEWFQNRKP